jgi:hypothetical protein
MEGKIKIIRPNSEIYKKRHKIRGLMKKKMFSGKSSEL